MIAIIDYDVGNIGAVENMLSRLGIACRITKCEEDIMQASGIILPGNGAFDACVNNLRESHLIPPLEKRVLQDKRPLLGICVGAQMLGKGSEEGNLPGLGWLDMQVKRFPSSLGLHIPHMGWREVVSRQPSHELLTDFDNNARFYFVHSYYMQPTNPDLTLLECQYGIEFSAAVANTHIMGVQFHPEKSHRFGKKLLTNFARMTMK